MANLTYLLKSIKKSFHASSRVCQNCKSPASTVLRRKYFVTALRRCDKCGMMFRTPIDTAEDNFSFYNNDYQQGFTTELPSEGELKQLLAENFKGTTRDYAPYVSVMRRLGLEPGARVFDFGCSWGYGSYQLSKAGYDVLAYEISKPRREYGVRNLQVQAVGNLEEALSTGSGSFDCFFSAHVLEHVPSPNDAFKLAYDLLKPGGLFLSFTPNGSAEFRSKNPNWMGLWGEVHPNMIDDEFLDRQFSHSPRLFGTRVDPKFNLETMGTEGQGIRLPMDREELAFAAKKTGSTW